MNSKEINIIILAVLFCFFTMNSALPQVAINTDGAQPNTRSILDVASTTLGVLLPRMTEAQRTAITSPPQGLLVFQIDGGANAGLYYATGEGSNWTLIFHSNTTAITGNGSTNYIPYWTSTNALAFTGMYWDNTNGRLGIGTTTPLNRFEVSGSTFNRIAASVTADVQSGFQIIRTAGANDVSWEMYTPAGSTNLRFAKKLPADASSIDILTFQDNGNVGIGTTTPTTKLDVNGSITSTAVSIQRPSADPSVGNAPCILFSNTGVGYCDLIQGGSAAGMQFFSYVGGGWTERMRIASSGNVGIGTTAPNLILDITGPSGSATNQENATTNSFQIETGKTTGEQILYMGNDKTNHLSYIQSVNYATNMTPLILNARGGFVGIGTATPTHLLHLNGGAYCDGANWMNASDSRLKRNIQPMSKYGLKEVMLLNPVTYFYKSDSTNHPEVGFIAQDVMKIIPEVVSGKEGDLAKGETLGLSYGNLVPVLTKAIQEQQSEISSLKSEMEQMKSDIQQLKSGSAPSNAGFGGNTLIVLLLVIGIALGVVLYRKVSK